MTSAVFHFILGLTLGILIALALINRYHLGDRNFNRDSNNSELALEFSSQNTKPSIRDIVTVATTSKEAPAGVINSRSNGPLDKDAESADGIAASGGKTGGKSSTSFWVPGTKGAYLKFKNQKSDADNSTPAVAEPVKTEPNTEHKDSKPANAKSVRAEGDGDDLEDMRKRGAKKRYGSGSAAAGSIVAGGKGGAAKVVEDVERLSSEDAEEEEEEEQQAPAGPEAKGAGKQGSRKRKREKKGLRGGKKQKDEK